MVFFWNDLFKKGLLIFVKLIFLLLDKLVFFFIIFFIIKLLFKV